MALHRLVTSPGIYFISFTCFKWLPLIREINGYDLVYKWFDVLSRQDHTLVGYVIMPNHIHMLLHYNGRHQSLNTIVGNGKRFMAYGIVEQLRLQAKENILRLLSSGVRDKEKIRGKKHQVWESSFDIKECRTDDFVFQKLQYIHNNPRTGKWKLAESIIEYPHSSARFYITWKNDNYPVRDYREFLDFDNEE